MSKWVSYCFSKRKHIFCLGQSSHHISVRRPHSYTREDFEQKTVLYKNTNLRATTSHCNSEHRIYIFGKMKNWILNKSLMLRFFCICLRYRLVCTIHPKDEDCRCLLSLKTSIKLWDALRSELRCEGVGLTSPAAPLNPLDIKQPDVRVVPDGRIQVAIATESEGEKQDTVKKLFQHTRFPRNKSTDKQHVQDLAPFSYRK